MKKSLIIAAVAFCAIAAQAVSVSWSANTVTTDGNTDNKLPLGTITGYLFDASTSVSDALDAINAGGDTLAAVQVGNAGTSSTLAGAVNGSAKDVDENKYPKGSSASFYAIIIDTASNQYIVTATKTVTMKSSGATSVTLGSQQNNHSWQPVAVPEPTTVALLALGLAALGLKRKVA